MDQSSKRMPKRVEDAVEALSQELREKLSLDLQTEGKFSVEVAGVGDGKVELQKELVKIERAYSNRARSRIYTKCY